MEFKTASDNCAQTADACTQYLEKQGFNPAQMFNDPYKAMGSAVGGNIGQNVGQTAGKFINQSKPGGQIGRSIGQSVGGAAGDLYGKYGRTNEAKFKDSPWYGMLQNQRKGGSGAAGALGRAAGSLGHVFGQAQEAIGNATQISPNAGMVNPVPTGDLPSMYDQQMYELNRNDRQPFGQPYQPGQLDQSFAEPTIERQPDLRQSPPDRSREPLDDLRNAEDEIRKFLGVQKTSPGVMQQLPHHNTGQLPTYEPPRAAPARVGGVAQPLGGR
jgi:hypothetical protein